MNITGEATGRKKLFTIPVSFILTRPVLRAGTPEDYAGRRFAQVLTV